MKKDNSLFIFYCIVLLIIILGPLKRYSTPNNEIALFITLSVAMAFYIPFFMQRVKEYRQKLPYYLLLAIYVVTVCGGITALFLDLRMIGIGIIIGCCAFNFLILLVVTAYTLWQRFRYKKMSIELKDINLAFLLWFFPFLINFALAI